MIKLTQEQYIQKAISVHGNKFNYELVEYTGCFGKIKIICLLHGVFEQSAVSHIRGAGCKLCNGGVSINTEEFIIRAQLKHGDRYDYNLVKYIGGEIKVKIICKLHGIFEQKASAHLFGKGCHDCANNKKLNNEEFIIRAQLKHGDVYDYTLVSYKNSKGKVLIVCKIHGDFYQSVCNHLAGNGCPHCRSSKGERKIIDFLNKHNIIFIHQHSYEDCRNIKKLKFDFYLPEYDILIEYDGAQHFRVVKRFGGEEGFNKRKRNDTKKNKYADEKNVKLLRIAHFDFDNIEKILEDMLLSVKI